MKRLFFRLSATFLVLIASFPSLEAATFNGSSRVSASDTGSAFSGGTNNALTVSCWFKLSIPSGATLTQDIVILSNSQIANPSTASAFQFRFKVATAEIEFRARGTDGAQFTRTLITHPYLERWYHVAVTRDTNEFKGYVDGREVFTDSGSAIGSSSNSSGLTIGGASDAGFSLPGEVQEVAIYNARLPQVTIATYLFANQPAIPELKGYYKLGSVPNPDLENYATAAIDPATMSGAVLFEATNRAGEQSLFDSNKNGGRDATAPLSGSFSWEHTIFRRPTNGVPFEFKIGYKSSTAQGSANVPQFSPFNDNGLSPGWSHTFDVRLAPSTSLAQFFPPGTGNKLGLLLWDGSLETWEFISPIGAYQSVHGEYRGEMKFFGFPFDETATVEWTTPDRLIYRFVTPYTASATAGAGRLLDIRDFNGNKITLAWNLVHDRVTSATDTAGDACTFTYDPGNKLTGVTYLGWSANITFNANNRLATLTLNVPPGSSYNLVPTTWGFYYKTAAATDPTNGLLEKIADPRGYSAGVPAYYDVQITYDQYGREIEERDGLTPPRLTQTAYGVEQTGAVTPRKITRTDAAEKKWVETFDRKGRVIARRDPLGNTMTFEINDEAVEYGKKGTIKWTDDANANRTEFTYDARANVLTRKDALLRTTTWEYNASIGTVPNTLSLNKPTKEIRPATAETPAAGWETNYSYDGAGNLLMQSDAIGNLITNTYWGDVLGKRGMLKTSTDARSNTTSFDYTAEGFLASKTVPDVGNTTRTWNYGYTELGWLSTESDPLNRTTYLFQNINGQVISITDPFGRVFNKTFDANGNLTHDYDALGQLTLHAYDNADQKTQTTTRDGKVWAFFYTARGELESTRDPSLTNPSVRTVSYLYDDAGRRKKETDANGFFTTFDYDLNGNLRFTTDKELKLWEKTCDKLNRVITDKDPLGDTTFTAFDAAGRVDTVTSPRGFISRHEYDGRSRLTKWIDAENNPWIYTYDGNGNITRITDALGGHYDMQYGPRNERLREENQDHYVWLYTYDELLRLKTQTDPLPLAADPPQAPPVLRTLTYDLASRVEEVVFSTGRRTVFHYDLNNNPDEIRRVVPGQPSATLTLSYDAMDRVTQSLDAYGKTVGYTFDPAGRVKTITYPGAKTLTHGYDPAGRLTTLTDWVTPARVSNFGYDKAGRLTTHLYPNTVLDTIGYHDDGTVKKLDFTRAGGGTFTPFALEYAYDRNGNKTQEKKKGVLDWQPGPAAGQVAPFDESYTPRASGRLLSSTDALNPARNFTYTYNAAGDMTLAASPGQTTAFTYDEDHRVLNVTQAFQPVPPGPPQVTQIENRYDALGRRISRKLTPPASAAVETRYVLDLTGSMERILCDTTAAGAITTRYIHGPDGLGYREDATTGAITCFHADAMGNILRLTDNAGATTAQYAYNPYGRLLASSGTAANAYRFVGAQGVMEELPNLYFMRARYYSAETGIFLSTDPVKNIGQRWKSVAYEYAGSNPLNRSDPNGLFAVHMGAFWLGAGNEFLSEATNRINEVTIQISAESLGASPKDAKSLTEIASGIDDLSGTIVDADFAINLLNSGASTGGAGFSYLMGKYSAKLSVKAGDALTAGYLSGLTWVGDKAGNWLYNTMPGAFQPTQFSGSSSKANATPAAASYATTSNTSQQTKPAPVSSSSTSINTGGGGGSPSSVSTTSGGSSSITIKTGQTLSGIAAQNNTTVSKLLAANPQIKNPNVIYAGAKISVPSGGKKK